MNKLKCNEKIASAVLALNGLWLSIMTVYSNDLFEVANNAAGETKTKLVNLAEVLFPLALVILFISILFTKDQKALSMEIKLAVTICIVYALIILVGKGTVTTTVTQLINAGGGGGTPTPGGGG